MNTARETAGFPGRRIIALPPEVVAWARECPPLCRLLPTDVGCFPKAAGHLIERAVGVSKAIFIYCVHGQGWCELGGRHHRVQAGQLLVIPPEIPHAYGADQKHPWSIYWVHALGRDLDLHLEELGTSVEQPVLFIGEFARVLTLFDELIDIAAHGNGFTHLLYGSRTLAHLLGLMTWHRQQDGRCHLDSRQKIAQSIAYMKQRLDKPLTLTALAMAANLSTSHYTLLFKLQTGCSPIGYFTRLRMHKARQLLSTTRLGVREIGLRVGYKDPLHFSNRFRVLNEVSPTEYRRERNVTARQLCTPPPVDSETAAPTCSGSEDFVNGSARRVKASDMLFVHT